MTNYQILDLIISGFAALGTCGATVVALFLSSREKIVYLRFSSMHGDSFGNVFPNLSDGCLVLRFTNTGYKPISLELAGFKFIYGNLFSKRKICIDFSMNKNLENDQLPKLLQLGETYTYRKEWNEFFSLCKKIKKENGFQKVKAYAYVSSLQKEIEFDFDKNILEEILK